MNRIIPLLTIIFVLAGIAFVAFVIIPWLRRKIELRAKIRENKAARLEEIERYQQRKALEGPERTYDRIEADQDAMYEARRNPLDLGSASAGSVLIAGLVVFVILVVALGLTDFAYEFAG